MVQYLPEILETPNNNQFITSLHKVMWCQGVLRLASIPAKGVLMNHVGSKLFIQRINDLGAELCIARLIT